MLLKSHITRIDVIEIDASARVNKDYQNLSASGSTEIWKLLFLKTVWLNAGNAEVRRPFLRFLLSFVWLCRHVTHRVFMFRLCSFLYQEQHSSSARSILTRTTVLKTVPVKSSALEEWLGAECILPLYRDCYLTEWLAGLTARNAAVQGKPPPLSARSFLE